MNGVGEPKNPIKRSKKKTHRSHKYLKNLALRYTSLQRLDSNQYQCVDFLQNAPKHRYRPSLNSTLNHQLGRRANKVISLVSNMRSRKTRSIETRELEVRG